MANIKGFTYSLSVDEAKSLSNLKTSIKNIQQKGSNLSIPVNLKINTTIPRETLSSAKEALGKKKLTLAVDLKINARSITNSTIAEAQKLLNEKNKQLAMNVGLKIDSKALNNVKQINDVFKETKNTLDEIVKDISKLAGVKLQIFEGVDSQGVSTSRTKTRPSNTNDLQKEIDFQQTSLQILLEKLKTQKAYESILNDPIEGERLRLLQERVNALGLEARTIAEVKEEVRDLKQEYSSIVQGGKLILWQDDQIAKGKQYYENLEKANKALQEEIKKQQETLQARYRSMSQMSQIKVLANEERMAWENVGKAINGLDGKSIDEVREKARQIKLEMTNIKTDGVEKLNSSWQKLKTTLISIPAQYVSVYTAIRTAEAVFKSATSHIMEVDQAYTNMSMTMQSMSKDTFNGMLSQINAMSKGMGAVSGEVLKIAQTFANDNTSITEVIDKLQSSIALMNVSGMEATEVTKSIMSIANSYQMLADDGSNAAEVTEYLGDVLTKTSANMAMDFTEGMQGLISGIGVAGSTMKAAGVDMEWYVGMLGNAMVATGQSADKLGRGMRTITARVMQQKQALEEMGESVEEVEIAMAKGEKTLNEIGISIRDDLSGDLKSFSSIMNELGAKWDGLTDSTKYYLAEQLAGKNQMDIFIGMMDSYEQGLELVNNAYESQGSLMEMNGKFADSLKGKLNTLTSAQQQLYQSLVNSDALKTTIDMYTGLINVLSSLIETFGILPVGITGVSTALLQATSVGRQFRDNIMMAIPTLDNWNTNLGTLTTSYKDAINENRTMITRLKEYEVSLKSAGLSTQTLGSSLTSLRSGLITTQAKMIATTVATQALQMALSMGLSVAIGLVVSGIGKLIEKFKEFNHGKTIEGISESASKLEESVKGYTDSVEKLNSVKSDVASMRELLSSIDEENDSLEVQKEKIDEVNQLLSNHAPDYESIESILNNENIALETRIKLLEQQAELQQQIKANEAMEEVTKTDWSGNTTFDNAMEKGESVAKQLVDAQKLFNSSVDDIENGVVFSLRGKASLLEDASKEFTDKVETLTTEAQSTAVEASNIMNSYLTLHDVGRIDDAQLQAIKEQYLNTIEEIKVALAEVGKEDVAIFNLFDEEELDKAEEVTDKMLEFKQKMAESFNETYVSPFAFDNISELDQATDKFQELYETNSAFVDLLNEANGIEFRDGHPYSKSFADVIDSNIGTAEGFQSALLTINELFEDMSDVDLSEMFGSDLASQIQDVLDIDLSTPWEEMSDSAKQAVSDVIGSFNDMEDSLKESFYKLNATNGDFYQELLEKNASTFNALDERWGTSANEYANVAEYKRAIDQEAYTALMSMDAEALNALYQNTLTLLGIKEEAGEERVSMEDQAAFLINGIDLKELKSKLEVEKGKLQASKEKLEGELLAEQTKHNDSLTMQADSANNSLNLEDEAMVKSLQMMQTMAGRATSGYDSFYGTMKATGALEGLAISATGGRATVNTSSLAQGNVSKKAVDLQNNLDSINNKIQGIDAILNSIDAFEKLTTGDLSFNITPYNPTNSSTTSSGGYKPSSSSGGSGSSGGGGGGSSSTEKEVADMESLIDRYYELNDAIKDVENALKKNQTLQEQTSSYDERKKLMEEEIELLNKQKTALENLKKEQEKELSENKSVLVSYGFTFDSDNNILNYASRLKQLQDQANSLSGEAKENAIEQVNLIASIIEAYTTLSNETIPDTENQILEMNKTIKDTQKEHEELLKLVERLGNRYFELEQSIKKVDNALALNQAQQKNVHASERVKLIEEEIELLRERQKLVAQQQKEVQMEVDEVRVELVEKGVTFNDDGSISNYTKLIEKLTQEANKLIGDARDEAVEEIEDLIDKMEEYDELVGDTLPTLAQEWEEYATSIYEAEKEKAQTITDMQKDVSSAIENEYNKRYEALKNSLQKEKDLYEAQFEQEDWDNNLATEQRKLDEIQQQINSLSRDTSLAGQLKLQQLKDEYDAQLEVINQMIRDKEKELGSNRFDEEMDKLDQEKEETLSTENLANMVNKALADGFVTIGEEVIELNSLMTDWLDETGDGLTAVGNYLKSELIENLRVAQGLMENMGLIDVNSLSNAFTQSRTMDNTKSLVDISRTVSDAGRSVSNELVQNVKIENLLTVQGNVTEDSLPQLEKMIEEAKDDLLSDIAKELRYR